MGIISMIKNYMTNIKKKIVALTIKIKKNKIIIL